MRMMHFRVQHRSQRFFVGRRWYDELRAPSVPRRYTLSSTVQ
ncbi:hypothetical protein [Ottowia sp.]|nr:hypothetical protein [Ottowia sp.]